LEKHGMTAYLQTNIPQGLWGIESNNRIFEISSNPYDERFVSGGSSGGEAAVVRMCCSAFDV
jgi:amidase